MFSQAKTLLADGPFRNFFIGRTISKIGNALAPLAIAFGVLDAGGSAADLGVILAAGTLPQLLLLLFGGIVGDRFERRMILIATDLVMGAAQALAAVLLITRSAHVWQLAALQFLVGCANAFFNPASNGAVRDFVGPAKVQAAQSLLSISGSSARIVGPALAGAIIATSNAGIALAIDAASFFLSAMFLFGVRLPKRTVTIGKSIREDLAEGWREVASRSWVWGYILSACIFQATSLPALAILGPVISRSQLGGAGGWASVLAAQSFGALVAGFILMRWRPAYPMRSAVLLLLLSAPLVFVLALPGLQLWWLLIPAVLAGISIPMADTLWFAALAENIPESAQARVSSYDWLGSLAFAPVGYWAIGQISGNFAASSILIFVGLLELLTTAVSISIPSMRSLKRAVETH